MPPPFRLPSLPPMPRSVRRFAPLVFALVMGLLAVSMVQRYIASERHKLRQKWDELTASYRNPVDVMVAAKDLPPEAPIQVEDLAAAQIPERFVQPYAVQAPDQLIGQVPIAPIAQGEQVLLNKIRQAEEGRRGNTLSDILPKGTRAVTIATDTLSGVGGLVRPGDAVDVLWTVRLPQIGEQQSQIVTLVLFQGVPVLAIGVQLATQRPRSPEEEAAMAAQGGANTVTLALTPQEASILLFAREQGQLQLSLRSQSEKEGERIAIAPTDNNVLLEYVFGHSVQPPPPPPPPKGPEQRSVEVYRGLERSVISVDVGDNDEATNAP